MPGCSAVKCSNSTDKGFLMKRFPRDIQRRKQWLIKTKWDNWIPTEHSYLCEVHFAPEMWEKTREDGSRKLKATAVPTIFSFTQPKRTRKPPLQRNPLPLKKVKMPVTVTSEEGEPVEISQGINVPDIVSIQPSPSTTDNLITKLKKRYEKLFCTEVSRVKKYKALLRKMRLKLNKHEEQCKADPNKILLSLFNNDQLMALKKRQSKKSTKLMKWSNETVTNSLKLKFSCGNNGYKELLEQGFPLPSIRTLQRRLQDVKFDSGVLHEVFQFLEIKVQKYGPYDKDCVLVLDEMAISPGKIFDGSLNKYFGEVTLPKHTGMATHVLVFMLGGISTRWKQVVAYYFTGNSTNGSVFENIIHEIFEKAEALGLNILSVTSDMGACNQALWRTWEVSAGRHSPVNCKIPHPIHTNKFIYIFADVPHLFKNIKSMLMTNKVIKLPESIVKNMFYLATKFYPVIYKKLWPNRNIIPLN